MKEKKLDKKIHKARKKLASTKAKLDKLVNKRSKAAAKAASRNGGTSAEHTAKKHASVASNSGDAL